MCAFRLFVFQFVSFKRAAKVTLFSNLPNFIAKVFVLFSNLTNGIGQID